MSRNASGKLVAVEFAVLRIEEGYRGFRLKARLQAVLQLFEDYLGDGGKLFLPGVRECQPLEFYEFGIWPGDARQFGGYRVAVGGEEAGVQTARPAGRRDCPRNENE